MRLLIVNCGKSVLGAYIADAAARWTPKPSINNLIQLNMLAPNVNHFKKTIEEMAPDHIILIPELYREDYTTNEYNVAQNEYSTNAFSSIVKTVCRNTDIFSGRIMLISSVDVIGDAPVRTESSQVMPITEYGSFLRLAEQQIRYISRHHIIRLPLTLEDSRVQHWLSYDAKKGLPAGDNCIFNLIKLKEVVKPILLRLESGWFGTHHITPNDMIELANLKHCEHGDVRTNDMVLHGGSNQFVAMTKLTPSIKIWEEAIKAKEEGYDLL